MLSSNKSYKNRNVSLTIHCKYKYFDSVVQRAEDRRQEFYFCRLPFAVNVKLNLSINKAKRESDLLITSMITDDVLLPINQNFNKIRERNKASIER